MTILDIPLLIKAAVLGVVEGLTEFLPISSTGHLILASSLLSFDNHAATVFEITIQVGAILAVVWHYRQRLAATVTDFGTDAVRRRFALNLLIAFLPAAVMGLLVGSFVKARLFHPIPVAIAFVAGGLVILWVERRHGSNRSPKAVSTRVQTIDDLTVIDALRIGLVQCAALVPGTSRSGATIIGSMLFGLPRTVATEFSFYLGIPTLFAAAGYSLWQQRHELESADLPMFVTGLVMAFVSALVCIRWLIRYVSTHDFRAFGWYRIVFGGFILTTSALGWLSWPAS
jgi:undecaprenyl-diphosphatase